MAKLASNFKNMVLSLTLVTVVVAVALASVYGATKDTIEEAKAREKQQALAQVLPAYESLNERQLGDYPCYDALDKDGNVLASAVETTTDGFGGIVRVLVGFDKEDKITNYVVLEQTETPGLGTHMVEWFKNADKPNQNIVGRVANGQLTVSKDGGEIDAITAATISSRAFLEAINKAYIALKGQDANVESSNEKGDE